jgi:hypothetical protein
MAPEIQPFRRKETARLLERCDGKTGPTRIETAFGTTVGEATCQPL